MKSQTAAFIIVFTTFVSSVREIALLALGNTDPILHEICGCFCVAIPALRHLLFALIP